MAPTPGRSPVSSRAQANDIMLRYNEQKTMQEAGKKLKRAQFGFFHSMFGMVDVLDILFGHRRGWVERALSAIFAVMLSQLEASHVIYLFKADERKKSMASW